MAKVNRFGKASVLNPNELQLLWGESGTPYDLICQLAYFTAGRIGEVLQLRAEDIRGGEITYRAITTKTRTTRSVKIPVQLQDALRLGRLPGSGYLFPGAGSSGHLSARAVESHIKEAARLLGFEGMSTHTFRRSMATHLHMQGVPLRAIQKITGHATLSALEQYLDIDRQEAAEQHHAALDRLFG